MIEATRMKRQSIEEQDEKYTKKESKKLEVATMQFVTIFDFVPAHVLGEILG